VNATALPAEIRVEDSFDRVVYRLPRRRMGVLRLAGTLLALFGLAPVGMGGFFLWTVSSQIGEALDEAPLVFKLVAGLIMLFPVAFVAIGFGLSLAGLMLAMGHAEIEITPRRLIGRSRAGPLAFARGRPRREVLRIAVIRGRPPVSSNAPSTQIPGWLPPAAEDWCSLLAECAHAKPLQLAFGYPEPWLAALADDLVRRGENILPDDFSLSFPRRVTVAHESSDPEVIRRWPVRPDGCRLVLDERPEGRTITLPPVGILRGIHPFLLVWTIGWCLIAFPMTAGVVALALAGEFDEVDGGVLLPLLFMMPFVLIGVGALLAAIHRGRRSTILAVAGNRLLVVQKGLKARMNGCDERPRSRTAQDLGLPISDCGSGAFGTSSLPWRARSR
jgi:hypothetical protein